MTLREIAVEVMWLSPSRAQYRFPGTRWLFQADAGVRSGGGWFNPYVWIVVLGLQVGVGMLMEDANDHA